MLNVLNSIRSVFHRVPAKAPTLLLGLSLAVHYVGASPQPRAQAPRESYAAVILDCHDGDTCIAQASPQSPRIKLRLAGIDAPERAWGKKAGQPYGEESRRYLVDLVKGKTVRVDILENDPYGRYVARLYLIEPGIPVPREVNAMLVERGYAFAYRSSPRFARQNLKYSELEAVARSRKAGFWAETDRPVEPWEHRKKKKPRRG